MAIKKVTLVGANGRLGPSILDALLENGFEVTVLTRASSKSEYADSINRATVPDSMDHDDLVAAFKGQDALVIAITGTQVDTSIKFADAALEAGVKRVIPADYGSCDSSDPRTLDLVPLYMGKKKVRDHLVELSTKSNGALTWTALINGHFLDYGLESGLLQFDLRKKTARIFDGGDIKWSATTLADIALAVVRILQHEEQTKNRIVYVQSLSTTQNELLKTVEAVMGQTFEVTHTDSQQFIDEHKALLAKDAQNGEVIEELVSVEGTVNADWESKDGFLNEALGMPERNLEDVVKKVVAAL